MKLKPRQRPRPRIEMLPLIDIVFLLLVFFIYAMLSMAVHRGMGFQLPGSTRALPTKAAPLSLAVKSAPGGLALYLNKQPLLLEELEAALGRAMVAPASQNAPELLLFADPSISYQQLFRILDRIDRAGIEKISLQAVAERP